MDPGFKNLDVAEACQLAGADPDYSIMDLSYATATGNFVSCSLGIQWIMKGVWLMHSQARAAIII